MSNVPKLKILSNFYCKMDCLICTKKAEKCDNFDENTVDYSLVLCSVLGIPSTLSCHFKPTALCSNCHVKCLKICKIFGLLSRLRAEVVEDLVASQRFAQIHGHLSKERDEIVEEITKLAEESQKNVNFCTPLELVCAKLEPIDDDAEDFDTFFDTPGQEIDDFNETPAGAAGISYEKVQNPGPKSSKISKNLAIILEPLPNIDTNIDTYDTNVEPMASYIGRNHKKKTMVKKTTKKTIKKPSKTKLTIIKKYKSRNSNTKTALIDTTTTETKKRKGRKQMLKSCSECKIDFRTVQQFEVHQRTVHSVDLFYCDQCGKGFTSSTYFREHMRRHGVGKKLYKCETCGIHVGRPSQLKLHIQKVHEGLKPWLCDACSKEFTQKRDLDDHVLVVHLGQKYQCPNNDCDKSFSSANAMHSHVQRFHEKAFKFFCSECPKAFMGKFEHDQHVQSFHLKLKPFKCTQSADCEKSYFTKRDLENHILFNHSEERNFTCTTCSKAYATEKALKRHKAEVHFEGENTLSCDKCLKKFTAKHRLKHHYKKHLDISERQVVQCELCSNVYMDKYKLKRHQRKSHKIAF